MHPLHSIHVIKGQISASFHSTAAKQIYTCTQKYQVTPTAKYILSQLQGILLEVKLPMHGKRKEVYGVLCTKLYTCRLLYAVITYYIKQTNTQHTAGIYNRSGSDYKVTHILNQEAIDYVTLTLSNDYMLLMEWSCERAAKFLSGR